MGAFSEIALSLLAVIGLLSISWFCFGRLLTPLGGERAVTVLPGKGDGAELEQAVRGILWLRGSGLLSGRVIIVDCGLTAAGRAVCDMLCLREPALEVRGAGELAEYIGEQDGPGD